MRARRGLSALTRTIAGGRVGDAHVWRTLDEATRRRVVDWLTVLLAVSLPWSTSATGILSALWLVAVLFTLTSGGP